MPTEQQTAMQAAQRYHNDIRFRALAQSVVSRAMHEHGRVDPERAEEHAYDIAIKVSIILLETVFQNDAELNAMRHERDQFRMLAEQAVRLSPVPMFILKGVPSDAD